MEIRISIPGWRWWSTRLGRHPWLIEAASHLQPPGPAILAVLEFALGTLEPTGRYPRFAAAVTQGGPPASEPGDQFERLLDRILDGLVP